MIDRIPTVDDVARMRRDGYLVVRNFVSAHQLAELLQWTAQLEGAPEVSGRHWVYREDSVTTPGRRVIQRIENFCPYHAGFDRFIRDGALTRWTGALMGGSRGPVQGQNQLQDARRRRLQGAPGSTGRLDGYAPLFVTAMVTLDAATVENGCLEVSAGRHREGLIGEQWKPLEEQGLSLQPVPTAPGDVIFFDSFVPHASKPNLTDSPRRILYITYNLASDGDHRERYFADKHASFPPDIDRDREKTYVFRV